MSFRFKPKESVARAIRRVGDERIRHALKCMEAPDGGEPIHEARKDIKKTRAAIRLVETQIPRKRFRRLMRLFRQAARELASSRDAHVRLATVRALERHGKGQLASSVLHRIRMKLEADVDEEMKRFRKTKTACRVRKKLRAARRELRSVKVRDKEWTALGPGLRKVYRDGRRALQCAQTTPSPENSHAWRKCAKDLWYHLRLVRSIAPTLLERMTRDLDTLSESLGNDHDLFVLREHLAEHFARELATGQDLQPILERIEQHQRAQRAAAFAQGARIYREKPARFSRRLESYWKSWRRE